MGPKMGRWRRVEGEIIFRRNYSYLLCYTTQIGCTAHTHLVSLYENGQIREADEIPCKRDESYLDLMLYITQLVKILFWELKAVSFAFGTCMQSLFRVWFNKRQFFSFLWYVIKDWHLTSTFSTQWRCCILSTSVISWSK